MKKLFILINLCGFAFIAISQSVTLTTNGNIGPATLIGNNLNIPTYSNGVIEFAWGLNGNSNATSNSFLGTPFGTNIDLKFKRDGFFAGILTDLSKRNASFGVEAFNETSTGIYNAAFGTRALSLNTTGYNNTALGTIASYSNKKGFWNTALGRSALFYKH